ncbi:hypothetical protein PRJH_p098 (plasmid) [Providencia rustigianii]
MGYLAFALIIPRRGLTSSQTLAIPDDYALIPDDFARYWSTYSTAHHIQVHQPCVATLCVLPSVSLAIAHYATAQSLSLHPNVDCPSALTRDGSQTVTHLPDQIAPRGPPSHSVTQKRVNYLSVIPLHKPRYRMVIPG